MNLETPPLWLRSVPKREMTSACHKLIPRQVSAMDEVATQNEDIGDRWGRTRVLPGIRWPFRISLGDFVICHLIFLTHDFSLAFSRP
jgi:hypothetical protein